MQLFQFLQGSIYTNDISKEGTGTIFADKTPSHHMFDESGKKYPAEQKSRKKWSHSESMQIPECL